MLKIFDNDEEENQRLIIVDLILKNDSNSANISIFVYFVNRICYNSFNEHRHYSIILQKHDLK